MELVASLRMELLKARGKIRKKLNRQDRVLSLGADKENELNEQIASLNAQCLDLSLANGRLTSTEATMKV